MPFASQQGTSEFQAGWQPEHLVAGSTERGAGSSRGAKPFAVVDERGLREAGTDDGLMGLKPPQQQGRQRQQWWRPPGPVQPELVAISLVYLVQGLLGLSRLAVFTFLKDDLALAPATVALVTSTGYAPWMIKPVYGFLSDAVPLFGYRRRSYIVLCGLLGATAWSGMATLAGSTAAVVLFLLMGSMATACADVVADSVVVELVRRPGSKAGTAGSLQSLCWASASAGGIVSAYFSGSLVGDWGPRPVFLLTAAFPLLVTMAAMAIPEERAVLAGAVSASLDMGDKEKDGSNDISNGNGSSKSSLVSSDGSMLESVDDLPAVSAQQLQQLGAGGGTSSGSRGTNGIAAAFKQQAALLWQTGRQRTILLPAIFVFLWQATPSADTALLFFETNRLGFTPEVLGRIRLVGALASLAGVGLYNFKLKTVPLRKILLWSTLVGTALGFTQLMLVTGFNRQLGLSDELFALADTALLTVLGQVAFMPLLVLAARICPEGVEATLFATLMSLLNGGMFTGNALGSALTAGLGVTADNFDNLVPLVTLCTLSTLLPLPLLRLLPADVDKEAPEEKES